MGKNCFFVLVGFVAVDDDEDEEDVALEYDLDIF